MLLCKFLVIWLYWIMWCQVKYIRFFSTVFFLIKNFFFKFWKKLYFTCSISNLIFLNCCAGWEVHCSIYKGSYNVSNILNLNSPTPVYHFSIYIHVYTLFAHYSSSYLFLCHLPPPTSVAPPSPPPAESVRPSCPLEFLEERR
jgi:hypothetical protein